MNEPPAIAVDGIAKTWPARYRWFRSATPPVAVLRDVEFSVGRGEIVGLLGENGSGKTTLLKIIGGMARADSGSVRIFGSETRWNDAGVPRVAYEGGDRGFYARLSVRQNLALYGRLTGLRGSVLHERIAQVAQTVNVHADLERRFADLSTGFRQRVALARALLADPDVLLLDEPSRALDPLSAASLRAFVRSELVDRAGKTILLATNLVEEAAELADRVLVLNAKRVVASGLEPRQDGLSARAAQAFGRIRPG